MAHPLTRYRHEHGLSVEAMAKLADTTRQTIFRIENGGQTPSIDMAKKIIAATGGKLTGEDLIPDAIAAIRQIQGAA